MNSYFLRMTWAVERNFRYIVISELFFKPYQVTIPGTDGDDCTEMNQMADEIGLVYLLNKKRNCFHEVRCTVQRDAAPRI